MIPHHNIFMHQIPPARLLKHVTCRLRGVDIGSGFEVSGSGIIISATYPGTGCGSIGGVLTFFAKQQNQRTVGGTG
jgi:hypothetical protein